MHSVVFFDLTSSCIPSLPLLPSWAQLCALPFGHCLLSEIACLAQLPQCLTFRLETDIIRHK